MLVADEFGGGSASGNGLVDLAVIAIERGAGLQPGAFVSGNVIAWALSNYGSDQQQADILPDLIAGKSIGTLATADINGCWDAGGAAQLTRVNDGFALNGEMSMVQDGHVAEWLLVSAEVETELVQVLIPASSSGVEIAALDSIDLTRRFSSVRFADVEITNSQFVGKIGDARMAVERQLQIAIVLTLSESLGSMKRDFQMALDYAKVRFAFGRPIGSFQAIKHLLADTSLLLESSMAVLSAAVTAVQEEHADAAIVVSMAKAYVSESATSLAQNCLQVFGGIGFTWEHDHHLFMRRLAMDASLFGDPAWHRERIWNLYEM
jgi:alkylation response protein AidB-like acyl-CoA dehydrogenase